VRELIIRSLGSIFEGDRGNGGVGCLDTERRYLKLALPCSINFKLQYIMKLYFSTLLFALVAVTSAYAQEYKIVTTVESIVPMGIGRSRMVDPQTSVDYKAFTTERTDGKKSAQGDVKRDDIKIDNFEETKLLNFYSAVGINFQNISSNDAVVSSKLTELANEGWSLVFVTSGVESDAGRQDNNGIFITRYIFKRDKSAPHPNSN
jgi:hypothetical protein